MAKTKKRKSLMPVSKARNAYELLAEIRKLILEEPKRYDQGNWIDRGGEYHDELPACKTVGCVAGWVVVLKVKKPVSTPWVSDKAADILGLDDEDAYELFDGAAAGCTDCQTVAHARAGAAHIKRFMENHADALKAKAV